MPKHPAYAWPWPQVRAQILARDANLCQIRGPKCLGKADSVDHIIPVTKGGAWWDGQNLRSACRNCNLSRIDRTGQDGWRNSQTRITLVIGPPCSGKAAYVDGHKSDGDLIVDYERLAEAIGGDHETVLKARGSILSDLKRGKVSARRAFIVSSHPRAEELFPFHERVVVDPGQDQCISNAQAKGRPGEQDRIAGWYRDRSGEPKPSAEPSRDWYQSQA